MTKVAAIAFSPSNVGAPNPFSETNLNGAGKLFLGQTAGVLETSTPFDFGLAGYSTITQDIFTTTTPIQAASTMFTSAAVCKGVALTLHSGMKIQLDQQENVGRVGFFSQFVRVANGVKKVYTLPGFWQSFNEPNQFDGEPRIHLLLASSRDHIYALSIYQGGGSGGLNIQKSLDGENWVNHASIYMEEAATAPLTQALEGDSRGLPALKMAVSNSGNFIVIAAENGAAFSTNKGASWLPLNVNSSCNFNWYNDNGAIFLCAVRLTDMGCYGTKICDENGNILPTQWRKASTPWDPSKNRLDAGYVAS
jgi:hypothetical protein